MWKTVPPLTPPRLTLLVPFLISLRVSMESPVYTARVALETKLRAQEMLKLP